MCVCVWGWGGGGVRIRITDVVKGKQSKLHGLRKCCQTPGLVPRLSANTQFDSESLGCLRT